MRLALLLPLVCIFAHAAAPSAQEEYAREIVGKLAAPHLHGRGYVDHGDQRAADYILEQYEKMHVKAETQDFGFPVNTFPGKMRVRLDGTELVAGADYIVSAGSPKIKGEFEIVRPEDDKAKGDLSNLFVWVPNTFDPKTEPNPYKTAKGIIIERDKLTAHMAQIVQPYVMIEILKGKSPAAAPKKIMLHVETKFLPDYHSKNIIATVKGSADPNSYLIFTAHYDHLGELGDKAFFPGANDNASGTAMLLNLARYFSDPKNQPAISMAFISFSAEEVGLIGSKYYAEHPVIPLEQTKFLFNMDMVGTGDDGIQVVNSVDNAAEFKTLNDLNAKGGYLKEIKPRGNAKNSDHYWFTQHGVKSIFIYTLGGIRAYHDIYDRPETLPYTKFTELFKLLVDFSKTF